MTKCRTVVIIKIIPCYNKDTETLNKSLADLNALPLLILRILEYKLLIVSVDEVMLLLLQMV